ncbi:hypothetical protein BDN72DRAFT_901622 [Pluteus cervinus]|uniref:Uncharacterized protein n=1 Tax=Pluteus cervinus TaxID=181527 RepID=A0ACD3AFN8_9AGAR|nr:hypothetical protein BDN72DRAFT_901622 [Pluteus cervinus]
MRLGPDGTCITPEIQRQLEAGMFLCRNWPFPFDDVEDDELLLELGNMKPKIGSIRDGIISIRLLPLCAQNGVKSKSNLMFKDLSPLLNIPVEIFLEVIEHLHPLDLYHLSKTCSAMKAFVQRQLIPFRLHPAFPSLGGRSSFLDLLYAMSVKITSPYLTSYT